MDVNIIRKSLKKYNGTPSDEMRANLTAVILAIIWIAVLRGTDDVGIIALVACFLVLPIILKLTWATYRRKGAENLDKTSNAVFIEALEDQIEAVVKNPDGIVKLRWLIKLAKACIAKGIVTEQGFIIMLRKEADKSSKEKGINVVLNSMARKYGEWDEFLDIITDKTLDEILEELGPEEDPKETSEETEEGTDKKS